MNHSLKKADLASSALRIYLAHSLNQTEDIVRAAREESSRTTSVFRNDNITSDNWTLVLTEADRVVGFIKEGQKALETSQGLSWYFWNRLCIIDASQDALKEALLSSRCYSEESYKLHVSLSGKYVCKATYMNYAYEADQHDRERQLSQLWSLAAMNLSQAIELQLTVPAQPTQVINNFLQKAKSIQAEIVRCEHTWSAECLRLHTRALQHCRYAAAMEALYRAHKHRYALDAYEDAAEVREWLDRATISSELKLLERVASFYQQALDLVENDEAPGFCNFCRVSNPIDAARRLLSYLPQVRKIGTALVKMKEEHGQTVASESKCRDATMLLVWRILRTEQEKVILQHERLLDVVIEEDNGKIASMETLNGSLLVQISDHVREIRICRERVVQYKQRAAQALQGARPSELAHKCWTQAAVHMEAAAQVCIEEILKGTWQRRGLDESFEWLSQCKATKHFLYIVECVLPRAVEYLDKARGAEAGEKSGRDPREAQMWRKAAEGMVEKAGTMFINASGSGTSWRCFYGETDVFDHGKAYVQAAEYCLLAFKHRAVPDSDDRQNGARLTVLYERAAEILCGRAKSARIGILDSVIAFHVEAFRQFGSFSSVSAEDLALWEKASEYGKFVCDTPFDDFRHWYNAFSVTQSLLKQCAANRKARDASVLKARIALHVSAANTIQPEVLQGYEACLSVLEVIPSFPPPRGFTGLPDRQYQLALVAQIIHLRREALGPKTFTVPADVHGVLGRVVRKEQRLPMLQDHAQMLLLKFKCFHHQREAEDDRQVEKWDRAYDALTKLCDVYALHSVDLSHVQNNPGVLARLAYRKAVARCYAGTAESTVMSFGVPPQEPTALSEATKTTADAWKEAVKTVQEVRVTKTSSETHSQNASVVMERFLWVAEQAHATQEMVRAATERNELVKRAQQISEMGKFRELLREVALVACEVYRHPEEQGVIDAFSEIEARAKAAAELLRGNGMNISTYRS